MDIRPFFPRYPTKQNKTSTAPIIEPNAKPDTEPRKAAILRRPRPPPPLWDAPSPPPSIPPRNPMRLAKSPQQENKSTPVERVGSQNWRTVDDFVPTRTSSLRSVVASPQEQASDNVTSIRLITSTPTPADNLQRQQSDESVPTSEPGTHSVAATPTRPLSTSESIQAFEELTRIREPIPNSYPSFQHIEDFTSARDPGLHAINTPPARSLTIAHHGAPRLISTIDQRLGFGRSLHEEIKNLRQSYINDADDVFTPIKANGLPHRSASSASAHTPVRNFSLPSYGSPVKQATPARPLRRVRSRSVNVGFRAEASDLPALPVRWGEVWSTKKDEAQVESRQSLEAGKAEAPAVLPRTRPRPQSEPLLAAVLAPVPTLPSTSGYSKSATEVGSEEEEEEACIICGTIRRALARNPLCCVDRSKFGKACFKCWGMALSHSMTKEKREDWLCCIVCGRELMMDDVKRLAGRSTVLR